LSRSAALTLGSSRFQAQRAVSVREKGEVFAETAAWEPKVGKKTPLREVKTPHSRIVL
jgi:hypothetical protein